MVFFLLVQVIAETAHILQCFFALSDNFIHFLQTVCYALQRFLGLCQAAKAVLALKSSSYSGNKNEFNSVESDAQYALIYKYTHRIFTCM